ncbi:MAG: sulfite exporter TauE/SafE family protein [Acidothermales bacterium]|nr:sulfite exporter TauE/SafE family protein [Acidothermales bacterium]
MTPWQDVATLAAGIGAGTINTIVGSGSLVTFPALVALGYPPVVANMSNRVGLVPGSLSGAIGYRRELTGQRRRAGLLSVVSAVGGLLGAALVLVLPESAFNAVVPALIVLAIVLVIVQPKLSEWTARRGGTHDRVPGMLAGTFGASVYGGYFGGQGVILMGVLGVFAHDELQRINAVKNVSAGIANLFAALLFVVVAHVAWTVAGLIAAGSIVGGQIGARIGRRLPPLVLRIVIVLVGLAGLARLLLG